MAVGLVSVSGGSFMLHGIKCASVSISGDVDLGSSSIFLQFGVSFWCRRTSCFRVNFLLHLLHP